MEEAGIDISFLRLIQLEGEFCSTAAGAGVTNLSQKIF